MGRYKVTETPDRTAWGIADRLLGDYCSLPDGEGGLVPLTWRAREGAEAWMQRCYLAWQRGIVPAPRQWRPLPPAASEVWVIPDGRPARREIAMGAMARVWPEHGM